MSSISFIVITKDSELTLARCLTSIQRSALPGDQLILVLNNSNIATQSVASTFSRWMIVNEEKQGPAYARNRGASFAKCELLYFIDSDIELSDNWRHLIEEQFSRPWTMLGGMRIRYEKSDQLHVWVKRVLSSASKRRYYFVQTASQPAYLTHLYSDTASFLVRRHWFEQLEGFDSRYRYHEDTQFTLKTLREGGDIFYEDRTYNLEVADRRENVLNYILNFYRQSRQFSDLAREFSIDVSLPFRWGTPFSCRFPRSPSRWLVHQLAVLIQYMGLTSGTPLVLEHRSSARNAKNMKKYYLTGVDPFARSVWIGAKEKLYDLRQRRWLMTE